MKSGRSLLVLGGLLAAAPTVQAQFPAGFNGNYCGGDNFTTCATVAASLAGNVVTLTVTNTSGDAGSVFTAIGLANMGAGVCLSGFSFVGSGSWTGACPPGGLNGAGIVPPAVGADATSPAPTNGLKNGQSVTFTFTLTGTYSLANVQFALHDQGGSPGGTCAGSTKLVVSRVGETANWAANSPPAECDDILDPPTSVPEPATMGLLALGLVGMGGASLMRRRRKS